jgi:precorrin-3B C17-methyltransferase
VVGLGPGNALDRTPRASAAIAASSVIVGYRAYVDQITDLTAGKQVIATAMLQETERCRQALELAAGGHVVSLVSSGDPGIYGMAGLAYELAEALQLDVEIEIVPGMTAASTAAARLGAPLMLDFAVISLSDLLVPWEQIVNRLHAVAQADLAVALYNPRSHRRVEQLRQAAAIFLEHRAASTPVGIATALGAPDEHVLLSTLGSFLDAEINMRSIVLVGSSSTRVINGKMVTPRGYQL